MQNKEGTTPEGIRKRVRFSSEDDLALLREVVNINPLITPSKWQEVRDTVHEITSKAFTVRCLKDHLYLLLETWKKRDTTNLVKSGVEEVYSEKDNLLLEVSNICREFKVDLKCPKKAIISRDQKIINLGKEQRDNSSKVFFEKISSGTNRAKCDSESQHEELILVDEHDYCSQEQISLETPDTGHNLPTKSLGDNCETKNKPSTNSVLKPSGQRKAKVHPMRKDALQFVQERALRDYNMKNRELDIEERKLALQEKRLKLEEERFENEKEERRFRLQLEEKRFLHEQSSISKENQIIEQQKTLIDILIKKFDS